MSEIPPRLRSHVYQPAPVLTEERARELQKELTRLITKDLQLKIERELDDHIILGEN